MQPRKEVAPALTRGLAVLEMLGRDGQQSLEQLARKTGWPKSSVLRYLKALEELGAVSQAVSTRRWEALKQMREVENAEADRLTWARRWMAELAAESGHCVELYAVADGRLLLIDRAEPEGAEVTVVARIGFSRALDELEATTLVMRAFGRGPASAKAGWHWEGGEQKQVGAKASERLIREVRSRGIAADNDFNSNGIRRHAVPLLGAGGLEGVLAVAQRLTPRAEAEFKSIQNLLTSKLPNKKP